MAFQKGQSGNPGGRGTVKPWRAALDKALAKREKNKGPQALERVADACVKAACNGDVQAIREIGDRIDGKVPQGIIGGGENDPPVRVVNRIELVDLVGSPGSTTAKA